MPDLNQLMELINKVKSKQTTLDQVANQQVANQPWRRPGETQNAAQFAMGQGVTPAQSRGLNQLYGSILNRQRGQTRIGAATEGFERGSQLIDSIREKEKANNMLGAQTAVEGAQGELANVGKVYGLQQDDAKAAMTYDAALERNRIAAYNAQMRREDNAANRASRESIEAAKIKSKQDAVNQKKLDAKAEKAEAERITAEANVAGISEIMYNLKEINENIDGWTSGVSAKVGVAAPGGTDAKRQQGRYDSLKSKLAIGKLQEMRAAAANGASGFGQLTKNEFESLMNSIDTLDITNGIEEQREAIENIRKYYVKALADYSSVLSSVPQGDVDLSGYSPAAQAAIQEALNGS